MVPVLLSGGDASLFGQGAGSAAVLARSAIEAINGIGKLQYNKAENAATL